MSAKKTVNLEKEDWIAILVALEEAITSRREYKYPLNQIACGPFVGPHEKVTTLISDTNTPK